MEEYTTWKRANYIIWLTLIALISLATTSTLFSGVSFRGVLIVAILAFLYIQFKVSFSKCSWCGEYIINPAHFWFGTAILTNAKRCKKCGGASEKSI